MTQQLLRETFRAMGTECALFVSSTTTSTEAAHRALEAGRREVAACEYALSRFDPQSDLSRLNRNAGSWVAVDERLIAALEAALHARAETAGLFDPTILPALVAAGYDRSFELLVAQAPRPLGAWHAGARFEVDSKGRARVEAGAGIDLGGLGKGFAATRAIGAMREAWPMLTGAIADLGGDIGLWGTPPEGGVWLVDIADPRKDIGVVETLELFSGGVATSGAQTRRFGPGRGLHHLIDPRTGAPAECDSLAVTVVAASAMRAEIHATALTLGDLAAARKHLASRPDLGALWIPRTGQPIQLGRLTVAPKRRQRQLAITIPGGRMP
jgi:thiamine biosynthesis lipoprotein